MRAGYDPNQSQLPEELLQLATEMEGHPDNVEAQCHSVGAYVGAYEAT